MRFLRSIAQTEMLERPHEAYCTLRNETAFCEIAFYEIVFCETVFCEPAQFKCPLFTDTPYFKLQYLVAHFPRYGHISHLTVQRIYCL